MIDGDLHAMAVVHYALQLAVASFTRPARDRDSGAPYGWSSPPRAVTSPQAQGSVDESHRSMPAVLRTLAVLDNRPQLRLQSGGWE